MTIELKIPAVGESVQEIQIAQWLKQPGDPVEEDEPVVELETDKASLELPAPAAGRLAQVLKGDGETVTVGETIGYLEDDGGASPPAETKTAEARRPDEPARLEQPPDDSAGSPQPEDAVQTSTAAQAGERPQERPETAAQEEPETATPEAPPTAPVAVTPSARRALREHGLHAADVEPAGNRLRRTDVLRHVEQHGPTESRPQPPERAPAPRPTQEESDLEEVVPMSLIRRRIAERLVAAQHQAALLTTFNEIDMTAVSDLRKKHRDRFQNKYGIKLGLMSFFVKAGVEALKEIPELNAEIRGREIVYRNYCHIGIAIGTGKGLVVPVLRYAERMSFADIERAIDDFVQRAQQNKLEPEELAGGTFTISNGGIYGSLLSTPIVNPPQSGVLGMHAIQERPVACQGQVVIRPMMYVALTYDHRLVDGREAILFLRRVKDVIEEPARILMEV